MHSFLTLHDSRIRLSWHSNSYPFLFALSLLPTAAQSHQKGALCREEPCSIWAAASRLCCLVMLPKDQLPMWTYLMTPVLQPQWPSPFARPSAPFRKCCTLFVLIQSFDCYWGMLGVGKSSHLNSYLILLPSPPSFFLTSHQSPAGRRLFARETVLYEKRVNGEVLVGRDISLAAMGGDRRKSSTN